MHTDPLDTCKKEDTWRKFQSDFMIRRRRESLVRKICRILILMSVGAAIAVGGLYLTGHLQQLQDTLIAKKVTERPPKPVKLTTADVKYMTGQIPVLNAQKNIFKTAPFTDESGEKQSSHIIETSLDLRLQSLLVHRLDTLKTLTRGKPQTIAVVAVDPRTGFIKAMAGFDLGDARANPCTGHTYPAASIFKIVTAAAAVDDLGYTASTPLYFNGGKYTLYKRQLSDKKNKYTSRVSLASAFAQSINPVFGKLGQRHLGRETLAAYAEKFGFNQAVDTDFSFKPGIFEVQDTDTDYHLAELGCGFNHNTRISPVFAAMMVSAVVHQGQSVVPRMVDMIKDPEGQTVYKSKKAVYKTAMTQKSAREMVDIMQKTITRGTARKAFRGYTRDKILSGLILGGKTGSLFNDAHTVKYDWFTGFAREKNGSKILVVSIIVGHRKYIGTKAAQYARAMFKTYFTPVSVGNTQ